MVPSATRERKKARASSGVRFGAVPGCGSGSGSGSGSLSGFRFFSFADPLSGLAVFSALAVLSGSRSVVGSGSVELPVGSSGVDCVAAPSGEGAGVGSMEGYGAEATMSSWASCSLR